MLGLGCDAEQRSNGDDGGCGFLQYSTQGKFWVFLNSGQTGAVAEENVEQ